MGVFHVFQTAQMVPNSATHHVFKLDEFMAIPLDWLNFKLIRFNSSANCRQIV